MSLISGGKVIFCEGKQTSLDYGLLKRVVERLANNEGITIIPSGGKFTFSVFALGYFASQKMSPQKSLVFRDRDFDALPPEKVQLIQLNNTWLTYRACIENYLIDADLIDTYWRKKYAQKLENPISKWGHKDSPGIEVISAWIENSALLLQDYQAVRWALAELLLNSTSRIQLRTTWTGGSGKLPLSLDLAICQSLAKELINQFREAVETITLAQFETHLADYQQKFKTQEFWTQKQYLIWFHGKDIQKAMQQSEPKYISLAAFFEWAIIKLDVTKYPDILELQHKIEEL